MAIPGRGTFVERLESGASQPAGAAHSVNSSWRGWDTHSGGRLGRPGTTAGRLGLVTRAVAGSRERGSCDANGGWRPDSGFTRGADHSGRLQRPGSLRRLV